MVVGTVDCAPEGAAANPTHQGEVAAFPGVPRVPGAKREAPAGWAASLLTLDPDIRGREIARRALIGLSLASLYGVALGARVGAQSLFQHAIGVPLGLLLVALVGAPSVFVFLSMARAPIDGRAIAGSVARSVASAGLLLAGLAPAAALFVVSSETADAAAGAVTVGLWLGGGVALVRMLADVLRQGFAGKAESALGALAVAGGFALFAIALATRVWGDLPILGGG